MQPRVAAWQLPSVLEDSVLCTDLQGQHRSSRSGLQKLALAWSTCHWLPMAWPPTTLERFVEGLHIPGSARPPARPELPQAQIGCSSDSEDLSFFAKIDIHTGLGPRAHRPAAPNFHVAT